MFVKKTIIFIIFEKTIEKNCILRYHFSIKFVFNRMLKIKKYYNILIKILNNDFIRKMYKI